MYVFISLTPGIYGSSFKWVTSEHMLVINSSPPWTNDRHFADDIFRCIFVNEKFCILIQISVKFVPKGQIDYKSALVQVLV